MKRLTTLAAALLIAAPLVAAEAPKTDTTQTQAMAPQDSPLVAAAKKAAKKRTGKVTVITNATLVKDNNSRITTTDSQPPITLPSPDAALIAMQQQASQPQTKPGSTGRPSPAETERQKRAAHAQDSGPYSETPYVDEVTIAKAENPTTGSAQNPTNGTTQQPAAGQTQQNLPAGQAQSPDSMQPKKP
jgi:hypothetical protein